MLTCIQPKGATIKGLVDEFRCVVFVAVMLKMRLISTIEHLAADRTDDEMLFIVIGANAGAKLTHTGQPSATVRAQMID